MKVKALILLSFLFFILGCANPKINSYESENVTLDSTYNSAELEEIIAPYRNAVETKMNEVIGYCDSSLNAFKPESPLGNFAVDVIFLEAMMHEHKHFSDMNNDNTIALLNVGGFRAPINKGDITVGNIYELMPFDNSIAVVKLDAQGIKDMLTYLYTMNGQPVSNARFNLSAEEFHFTINNKVVPDNLESLYVITSDYLAGGGDKMNFLKNATEKWDSGVLMRNSFVNYIKNKKNIASKGIDGRMIIEK